MSKAKELARAIREEGNNYYFSPSLRQLVDAVLSEPEPEKKDLAKYIEQLKVELLDEDKQDSTWYSGAMYALRRVEEQLPVLSEPEPLRGFVEVTYTAHSDIIELIPINQYRVARFDDRCAVIPISDTDNSANVYMVKESYDEIKQKIKESQ